MRPVAGTQHSTPHFADDCFEILASSGPDIPEQHLTGKVKPWLSQVWSRQTFTANASQGDHHVGHRTHTGEHAGVNRAQHAFRHTENRPVESKRLRVPPMNGRIGVRQLT